MLSDKNYKIIFRCAFKVLNVLGVGFAEIVYRNALVHELRKNGLKAIAEDSINVHYEDIVVGQYRADILVKDYIIIETKCVERIINPHLSQVRNYLKATELEDGLILNFRHRSLEYKRVFS